MQPIPVYCNSKLFYFSNEFGYSIWPFRPHRNAWHKMQPSIGCVCVCVRVYSACLFVTSTSHAKKGKLTEMQFEMWAKGINDFFVCFCCVLVNNIQLLYFYIGYQIDGYQLAAIAIIWLNMFILCIVCLMWWLINFLSPSAHTCSFYPQIAGVSKRSRKGKVNER